jgi:hypothetical protein
VGSNIQHLAVADPPLRVALGLELRSEAEYEKIMQSGITVFLKAYGASNASLVKSVGLPSPSTKLR